MKFTKNFNFKKPEPLDTVNINDLNDSFDLIDEKLKETEQENKRLDSTFKELIINAGNSNAEIVDARGQGFDTLRDRLDNSDNEMNNLDDRVEKIETLQKDNEIEMSTENGYIVCENTNNGQITDVKIEGGTLVNLGGSVNSSFSQYQTIISTKQTLKPQTQYTIVVYNKGSNPVTFYRNESVFSEVNTPRTVEGKSSLMFVLETKSTVANNGLIKSQMAESTLFNLDVLVLEGYHTQNPPSYFEGLRSVDNLEILSSTKNLFDGLLQRGYWSSGSLQSSEYSIANVNDIPIMRNTTYHFEVEGYYNKFFIVELNENKQEIITHTLLNGSGSIRTTTGSYIRFCSLNNSDSALPLDTKIQIELGDTFTEYIEPKQNRKQVLFKNKSGSYEKVVLRSLPNGIKDTIEGHSGGKYYYHKRCKEIVLNGSEDWVLNNSMSVNKETSLKFETTKFSSLVSPINDANISNHIISDKFKSSTDSLNHSNPEECITQTVSPYNSISIRIAKSKLSSQDASGFTKWLQSNNVTIVVALAKEEVYECVNLDLDSYEGETSVICNSNITPSSMSFKVANHISNTVEVMKNRINDTETKITEILNSDMMQNLGTTGYKILPGGLILQWGIVTFTTQNNEGLFDAKVTFPISFPNKCFICTPTLDVVDSNGWGEVDNYIAHAYSLSSTSCNVRGKSIKTTTMNKSGFFRYLAIGY